MFRRKGFSQSLEMELRRQAEAGAEGGPPPSKGGSKTRDCLPWLTGRRRPRHPVPPADARRLTQEAGATAQASAVAEALSAGNAQAAAQVCDDSPL